MKKNRNIIDTSISPSSTWGAILWAMVQDKAVVYELEDVADAKNNTHLNPQIEIDKPEI